MPDEPGKKKDELLRLVTECESQAPRVEALGRDIAQSARLYRDIAGPFCQIFGQVPEEGLPPEQWDRHIETWRSLQGFMNGVLTSRPIVNTFVAATQSTANTAVSGVMLLQFEPPSSWPNQAAIEIAKTKLRVTLERYPLIEKARSSMHRLGLDAGGSARNTPLGLLNEAHGALERPVCHDGGAVAVLITLRECIHAAVAELLRRRPTQEPAPKFGAKVNSLGHQCGRPGLEEAHFGRLATDGDALMNELSGAKQADMPREAVSAAFHRGLLFLNALLSSIDERRLKPT